MLWETILLRRAKMSRPRYGVFTDIDNTFFRRDRENDSRELGVLLSQADVPLVAVTGAHVASVQKRMISKELPAFAAIASSVGTEIHFLHEDGSYEMDTEWRNRLLLKGFIREDIIRSLNKRIEELHEEHPEWQIEFQSGEEEEFKVSLFVYAASANEAALMVNFLSQPFLHFPTPWCEDINYTGSGKRFCFDVLAADKQEAVDYFAEKMEIERGIVAGDSGNDITMILFSSLKLIGVVVGGARAELIDAIRTATVSMKTVYLEEDAECLGPESLMKAVKQFFLLD